MQGTFLSIGRVFLPKEDEDGKSSLYQLEMVFDVKSRADNIKKMAESLGIAIKDGERRDNFVLYIKDSETISDFLAHLKASNAVLLLQNLKIERDVRNNANRAVNCSVANIEKTVAAAAEQISAIKKIQEKQGLQMLDEKLRELAEIRLNNPEASLNDLKDMLKDKVTKSGINHRMRKLMQIADEGGKD
jgi:DNA-binding protein WhiA